MKLTAYKTRISEKQELEACLLLLHRIGCTVHRHNTGGMRMKNADGSYRYVRFNEAGYPDISGHTSDGKAVYWEVKRHGGRATTEQRLFIDQAIKNGCLAGIGTCADLENELRKRGYVR